METKATKTIEREFLEYVDTVVREKLLLREKKLFEFENKTKKADEYRTYYSYDEVVEKVETFINDLKNNYKVLDDGIVILLENPQLTLADYFYESYNDLDIIDTESKLKEFMKWNNLDYTQIIEVEEGFYLIYESGKPVAFDKYDSLNNYELGISCFKIEFISSMRIDDIGFSLLFDSFNHCIELDFSAEGIEWQGTYDDERIHECFISPEHFAKLIEIVEKNEYSEKYLTKYM